MAHPWAKKCANLDQNYHSEIPIFGSTFEQTMHPSAKNPLNLGPKYQLAFPQMK
jgi:hypothetical protein